MKCTISFSYQREEGFHGKMTGEPEYGMNIKIVLSKMLVFIFEILEAASTSLTGIALQCIK